MAYDEQVVAAARQRLDQRLSAAVQQAQQLHTDACARFPRLAEIEKELSATLPELTRIILEGGDPAALETLQQHNLALQTEMAHILRSAGYGVDNFEPQYTCPLCRDTGYREGRVCDCYRKLLREEACRRLSTLSAMRLTDFDALDPELYDPLPDPKLGTSPRQRMLDVIAYCRTYAEHFSPDAPSLLLQGPTGTGKTHLSLAIAKRVTEQGYTVTYGSIQPLLRRMESEHFGRTEGDTEGQLADCDLLILDDLGMEFDSPFYRTCIYNLLNARLLEGQPTIISTNMTLSNIQERYGDQIASRLVGSFELLLCVGKDIRQQLRRRARG